jgi:hypothetical protein
MSVFLKDVIAQYWELMLEDEEQRVIELIRSESDSFPSYLISR